VSGRAAAATGRVLVEIADQVATVTLDRPPVNALSSGFYEEISAAVARISADPLVSVMVLMSASPRAFCAGADVTELAALSGPDAAQADARRQELARRVFGQLLDLPQPTIAVVDGPAIGAGAVIASCTDMRMGSPRASFRAARGGGRALRRRPAPDAAPAAGHRPAGCSSPRSPC
jgi:enoyl-CoA hydratase/carnithine racemase